MFEKVIAKTGHLIKEPVFNWAYDFLMSPAKRFAGRRLFDAQELKLLHRALLNQNLFGIAGRMVPEFEREFAKAYGVPYGVASTSGTAAIHTALGALDLNPGDEVITAPITDLGTIIPILYQQCIPIFADVDATCNMDPADVERKITSRTKAIIAVHLFGNPCDMEGLVEVARHQHLPLIEDCAQAHMTEYKGRYVGTIGDIGCFSFQQSKHMTTGDGGMTITSNKAYYERMKLFVDKGYARKGWGSRAYLFLAPNYRMNELTAAVGLAQLEKVRGVVAKRRELGTYLTELLADAQGIMPVPVTKGAQSSYWLYPFRLMDGQVDRFAQRMAAQNVWVSPGYIGKPIYLCSEALTAKKTFGRSQFPFNPKVTDARYDYVEGLCPAAEEALKHLVCVPLDESWDRAKVERVARLIRACVGEQQTAIAPSTPVQAARPPRDAMAPAGNGKTIRIGIVGCGQMGGWHLQAYQRNPQVEVVALVDPDEGRAAQLAQQAGGGARTYRSHTDMIREARVDGVSVCTVPSTHHDIVLDLLDAGIHVLCEKPLAISGAEAEAMVRKAAEQQRWLLTAFKFRFFEEVAQAKQLIEQGGIGRIVSFRLMFGGRMNMAGSWYARKALSGGGVVMDNGPHAFDLVRYLLGEIASTSATLRYGPQLEVEDAAHITCVLETGAAGSVDLSWSASVPTSTYLEIFGEDGTILLDPHGVTYRFSSWDDWKRLPHGISRQEAFASQIGHFVGAIRGTPPRVVIGDDGLQAQRLIEEIYRREDADVGALANAG